jgi:hypothetical protein
VPAEVAADGRPGGAVVEVAWSLEEVCAFFIAGREVAGTSEGIRLRGAG